ncbi:arginine--tRNA ligase [Metallumcola ferriviriculae]|uniref:Arginine--tRNA ligase n=1 Tax=Metallumcola ferriviriculae TaxID=3039180 RepID=A0AAU0UK78_9FIRM|nr:arginine--tRNA ligase [Desulfitibacteraceae bacterium MK1]
MNFFAEIQNQLVKELHIALENARDAGKISFDTLPEFVVEVPREKQHGDFATNVAMLLAKQAKMSPRSIATLIVEYFPAGDDIEKLEIAGPGFINFRLKNRWLYQVVPEVIARGCDYGNGDIGAGQKVQVEFVSANPTGLLHMGNARGAALGDSIANLLKKAGYDVSREFFINDAGNQIENFARSLEARYLQQLGQDVPFPDEGYHGADIIDTVKGFIDQVGDKYLSVDEELRREMLVKYALDEKLTAIREVLGQFGVKYDMWFSEQSLHDSGEINETIKRMNEQGYLVEQDNALWFKATEFGEEKDEVLVRSNGIPTYFAADIAYHRNKFERGFKWVINLWGADHHGHVSRMKGAMQALGYDPDKVQVVIMQLVRLFQGGESLRMSKRTGKYITLSELVEEVGRDAARYFFVMRGADSHLDFDLDLAKSQSQDNPVYYVQYAHARICSMIRQAEEEGRNIPDAAGVDFTLLHEDAELELVRKLAEFPEIVAGAAQALEPHRLTRYAHELAGQFHSFYGHCRVLGDDVALSDARITLVLAARIVLKNVLSLIGVSAPERM